MNAIATPTPTVEDLEQLFALDALEPRWKIVVHDDNVNTMEYVTAVFMRHFELDEHTALKRMLEVHMEGRSILDTGAKEKMEFHALAMGQYGLTASIEAEEA